MTQAQTNTVPVRELQVSPLIVDSTADTIDHPLDGPLLPAPVARFFASVARRLLPWAVPVGLIVLWQIASSQGWLSTRVLPAPLEVVKAAWTLTLSGELWTHVKVSAGRALAGCSIRSSSRRNAASRSRSAHQSNGRKTSASTCPPT